MGERVARAEGDLTPVAEQLAATGWLEVSYDELSVHPTSRAVAATRGWPAGDPEAVVERLLTALDHRGRDTGDRLYCVGRRNTRSDSQRLHQ